MLPRYPVHVISKGRSGCCLTAKFLLKDKVPFRLVIEPQERAAYAEHFDEALLEILPFSNLGLGGIPARNWVWEHAKASGAARHWILDDNIRCVYRFYKQKRLYCDSGTALACAEDFVDRYENVGVAGLNYASNMMGIGYPPFYLNNHVYSCLLIDNALPMRWRGRYNEDTDLCLQVLASGLCTVLVNAFVIHKMATMRMKGGNTDQLYKGDGRLTMANSLKRAWPYAVDVRRRHGRPQHVVNDNWSKFDTPLKLKPGIDLSNMPPNNYGLQLVQVADEIKSDRLKGILAYAQKGEQK